MLDLNNANKSKNRYIRNSMNKNCKIAKKKHNISKANHKT